LNRRKGRVLKMKKSRIAVALAAGACIFASSCSKAPTAPGNGNTNLISNPNFISNGQPSLAGWTINDSGNVKVVSNAPSGTTGLSLWLMPPTGGPFPGGVATTKVTGGSGSGVYTLTLWEKNLAGWYWGTVVMDQLRNGGTVSTISLDMRDTSWTQFTLSDTLDMRPSDTLRLIFYAQSLAVIAGHNSAPAVDTAISGCCFNQLSLVKAE
jgi:hypothetical protein